jgi:acyl carrier protein
VAEHERREEVVGIILEALESLNQELDEHARVDIGPATPLFGPDAQLDSLSLVSVIVDVETALTIRWNAPISLTDDRAMSRDISPFDDVGTLADYILELLAEIAPDAAS